MLAVCVGVTAPKEIDPTTLPWKRFAKEHAPLLGRFLRMLDHPGGLVELTIGVGIEVPPFFAGTRPALGSD
jgi:hypothetical protein